MGLERVINAHEVTYDFSCLMRAEGHKNVREMKCTEFGEAIFKNME
jgi:isocitrate dehydrogenase